MAQAVPGRSRDIAIEQVRLVDLRKVGGLGRRIGRGMGPAYKGLHRAHRAVAVKYLQAVALLRHGLLHPGQCLGRRGTQVTAVGLVTGHRRAGEVVAAQVTHVDRDIRRQPGHIHQPGLGRRVRNGSRPGQDGHRQQADGQQQRTADFQTHIPSLGTIKNAPAITGAAAQWWPQAKPTQKSYCNASSHERPRGSAMRVSQAAPAA